MAHLRPLRIAALSLLVLGALVQGGLARTVTHAMGRTEVPDAPKRVVVLTNEGTEALLALKVTPVGAVKSWLGKPWYDHIAPAMAGVEVVGTEHAVNLEVVAALQPDLILGNKQRHEEIYPQLGAIAPTVMSGTLHGRWQENFALYAEAVGRSADGGRVLAAFKARVEALSAALGDRRRERISLVRFMPGGARIYYKDTFAGVILDQIGFARPQSQDKAAFADRVTKERIPEMAGDRLFYYVYETGDDKATGAEKEWTAEPLWRGLDVVKAGKVHRVSDAIWNTAGGVIAADLMLDDLAAIYGIK